MSRLRPHKGNDHGAAAVEFALILPILLLLLVGIIEFGLAFNTQVSLTQAVREGVRVEALETGDGQQVGEDAFLAVAANDDYLTITVEQGCTDEGADRARVSGEYDYQGIILSFIGLNQIELSTEAVMRCGG